jgi:SAM-dependent methyltransferase
MFTHGICALREVGEEDFFPIDYGNMTKLDACRGCLIGDGCRGSWSRTFKMFGSDFLQPVRGGVANSFNYFPAPGPGIPERTLWTSWQGQAGPYVTDTADYTPDRLRQIRDDLGQVYLQLDDEPMINDFPGQLRKLLPKPGKGIGFTPSDRDPFATSEKQVRRILAGLQGRVLDVGCGQSQYGDLLQGKLESGEIDYVGIDPAPGKNVVELAESGLIDLREQALEDGEFGRGEFDWVLVLRSHNHLADLWTAYVRILAALRWGGRLLVVDNVSFGLVRPTVTEAAIKALPPGEGIEHLRDHDQHDAASFLQRFPLVEVERQAVGPTTANQWLLLYQKLWPGGQTGHDTYGSNDGGG